MKTWTVGALIEELAKLPVDAPVYLEDADTNWIIHLFEIRTGHTEHNGLIAPRSVLICPCDYGDMDSSLEFMFER